MRGERVWRLMVAVAVLAFFALVASPGAQAARPFTLTSLAGGGESSLLIKPDGSLWAWGDNDHGQLGVGDTTTRAMAWPVGTSTDWAGVACGDYHSLAVKTDGTLWAWGANASGQLGLGDTTDRTAPVQVGTSSGWATMACGDAYSMAIRSDGSLWAWGANASGQLGLGDTVTRTAPVQVGSDSDWAAVSCGSQFTVALKTDGTLWAWGADNHGQLGLGTTTAHSSPVQVGTDSDWTAVGCGDADVEALKSDGSLWAWGYNDYGQLGQGDTVARGTPTRVGQDSDWASVVRGDDSVVAIKSDGSLWAWGDDTYGQLGQGDTVARSLPTRIGSDADWASAASDDDATFALRQDGSLWDMGHNTTGELGLADFVNRASPTLAFFIGDTTAPTIASLASPTHPDPATWYASSAPSFTWSAADPSGIGGYRYQLDQSANTQPSIAYPSFGTSTTYTGKADGIWYFHLRALDRAGNWGPTTTEQVRIDTTAPVTTQTGADSAWHSGPVTVTFKATDAKSGVALTEYQLDGGSWTTGTKLTVSAIGAHTVLYRSHDKAGNVEAAKSCQVNIGTTFTITATAGAGGSISPSGVQTLNAGSTAVFAITPTLGYHVADVQVDGVSVGAVGSYEFDGLSASHTIAASFAPDPVNVLAVTWPNGGESLPAGVPVSVTWSSPPVASGVFTVWALSQSGSSYTLATVNANGGVAYGATWNVNVPPGSYRIRVSYGLTAGTYTSTDYSDGYFTVTPGATVTAPNGGESLPAGVPVSVTWSSPPVTSGVFTVWALSAGGTYYNIATVNATGATAYSATWKVKAPAGSYRIRVSYSVTAGSSYTITDYSDGYFTVTTS